MSFLTFGSLQEFRALQYFISTSSVKSLESDLGKNKQEKNMKMLINDVKDISSLQYEILQALKGPGIVAMQSIP